MLKLSEYDHSMPKEGDVYKELWIREKYFQIRYGYYEEYERNSKYNDPIPIYPDFLSQPQYTDDGIPFVTAMQDVCPYVMGKTEGDADSCLDCFHFHRYEDLIGLCHCPKNKRTDDKNTSQGGYENDT